MRIEIKDMITVPVKFQCDKCGFFVVREVKLGPGFMIMSSELPDGWMVRAEEPVFKCWCPRHSMDAK